MSEAIDMVVSGNKNLEHILENINSLSSYY